MRSVTIILVTALVGLQYKLWFGDGNLMQQKQLEQKLIVQTEENTKLLGRNRALEADIAELKVGAQALEEQARYDFGMIKRGEVYYQLID